MSRLPAANSYGSTSESHATPNFDNVARIYRWMEYLTFGTLLERCRLAQLDKLSAPRRALVLGDGDGRFLTRLLQHYPGLMVDAIDASPAMTRLAESRVDRIRASARVHFQVADVRTFMPRSNFSYDIIVAHFFLDCLTDSEVRALLERLAPTLKAKTTFLVSEFAIPLNNPLRLVSRVLVRMLYFAFRVLSGLQVNKLPNYATALNDAGFLCREERLILCGVLRSERWQRTASTLAPSEAT